ncbi:GNAT family N-acetyltransferase [Aquimarina sp. MMG016]|uniref:GNAT family N-acetyltransferase n=1 Tax=Aquimarina sp. MMG016 TaxID=2822690 RepID=UPI001B39D823|nr:GNAT family N-acetyltransferase [Aquimarina sp. MMG016]MBQ4819545.1 GNAT family N-acetyltransferase [Aquimarina sp. MMG016]
MKKQHIDYFFEVFEKSTIPELFSGIQEFNSDEILKNFDHKKSSLDQFYSVFFIPDYLQPILNDDRFITKKVSQFFKGYAIFLDGFSDVNAYLKHRFRSNAKGIRRRVNRLETCFDISCKMYYGKIQKDEYDHYMNSLEQMLIRRFEQRNDVSQSLLRWDHYKEMYFSLINEKRASLFVIMNGNNPIVVSLSHHFDNRLFSAISSYDIDYGKFSLGSVEIYKKLEWCIANDHKSYEMGMGDLSYKREWCNHIYNFEHQIIYPKASFVSRIKGNIEYLKVSLKEYIFKIAYVRYKSYKAKRKKSEPNQEIKYSVSKIEAVQFSEEYPVVDYNNEKYAFLRKMVFDFLYSAIENVSDVKVFQIPEEQKSFMIIGKSKMQKITLE